MQRYKLPPNKQEKADGFFQQKTKKTKKLLETKPIYMQENGTGKKRNEKYTPLYIESFPLKPPINHITLAMRIV